jgi:hypothetical protein
MLLHSEYSPVFKTLLLIVGIRMTLDGMTRIWEMFILLCLETEMVPLSSQTRATSNTHVVHWTSNL